MYVVWPGSTGLRSLVLVEWYATYCSGAVVPLPLLAYASALLLSLRTNAPEAPSRLRGVSTGMEGPDQVEGGQR
jgi:hypothetical protein